MSLTDALAIFGAVTGTAGLLWQVWSHRLTGGRIQLTASQHPSDGRSRVGATAINVGRLDVAIRGYCVWIEPRGMYVRKALWRLRTIRRLGLLRSRRTMSFPLPVVLFFAKNQSFADVGFPVIVKSGNMHVLPSVELGWPHEEKVRLRIAVHLTTGRIIRGKVADTGVAVDRPYWTPPSNGAWSTHVPSDTEVGDCHIIAAQSVGSVQFQ
ncbi:hypothetical protein [Streptomyces sp. NPDC087300]|uniref:hypothetical protein n=1 Tax=Streptomyces sp. NPDC087300 TaxID=3365780 RepID=UPI0037F944BC